MRGCVTGKTLLMVEREMSTATDPPLSQMSADGTALFATDTGEQELSAVAAAAYAKSEAWNGWGKQYVAE